jgi:PAS domain S-box-containing protein
VFVFVTDATDRRQQAQSVRDDNRRLQEQVREHAEQLGASEARFRLMAEGIRDVGIFFLNAEGRISDWTASAERLLGYSAAEALGQPADRFDPADAPGEDNDTLLALERATLLGQCESTGWRERNDGSRFWAHTVFTALHDTGSGEGSGYSCLMRDMTEVKRLEDLLRQLNQELEARVEERTRQLQDINQDLESFSYSVSHDLRAPLRHIGSFVDILREELGTDADPDVVRHLGTIAQAADHMGQLIEGLLAFSRLGRAPLQRKNVAMAALLQSSVNRVQHDPALRRAPSAMHWQLADDLPTVQGDGLLLSQVWDNLLANALKYTRPREVAEISVGWQVDQDGAPVFWVRDNGVGFDPRRADKLFGVFQRLHRATEFEGTGIGLALCRRIVERHGGRIWAESRPGAGSTFYFSLPAPDAASTDSTQQVQLG